MSRTHWMIACCIAAMLGLTGCSSDDVEDALGIDSEGEAAEQTVENVLNELVASAGAFSDVGRGLVDDLAPAPPALSAVLEFTACGDNDVACDNAPAGTFDCMVDNAASLWDLMFGTCTLSYNSETVTLNGGLGLSTATNTVLTLNNLQINGTDALSGTLTYTDGCTTSWNINASGDPSVQGTIVQCLTDEYPQSSSGPLSITATVPGVGVMQITINFDGDATATGTVTVNGSVFANCSSINLDTLTANCEGV